MKRSRINQILKESERFLRQRQVVLPPFGQWQPADWGDLDTSYAEIKDNMLGWDVTDFGTGDFDKYG
ncbi:D-lyxose/D-mannose family sugar isomerase, partial [Lacticaseibacillus rhamnosus]